MVFDCGASRTHVTYSEVHIYPHQGIDVAKAVQAFSYKHAHLREASLELPLAIFEAG